jgi:hypothetical protein
MWWCWPESLISLKKLHFLVWAPLLIHGLYVPQTRSWLRKFFKLRVHGCWRWQEWWVFYYFMILPWFVFFQFKLAFDYFSWYRYIYIYIPPLLLCKEREIITERRPPAMNIINIYTSRRTEGIASINTDKILLPLLLSLMQFVKCLCMLYTQLPQVQLLTACRSLDGKRMFLILFIFYLTSLIYLILLLQAACLNLKAQEISTGAADGLWYVYKYVILNYVLYFNRLLLLRLSCYSPDPVIKSKVNTLC